MDAIKFIREKYRMCHYQDGCLHCSIYQSKGSKLCADWVAANPEQAIKIVEQWSQTHPQKTMMQDFFEKFPNAPKDSFGNPMVCPQDLGYGDFCCDDTNHNCTMCWICPLEE